jgi:hypothetical protein
LGPEGANAERVHLEPALLERISGAPARVGATGGHQDATADGLLDDDGLLALLRATARSYFEQDQALFERNLETLLVGPVLPRRVLVLMRENRLGAGSSAEQGAILGLGFGDVACSARRPGE